MEEIKKSQYEIKNLGKEVGDLGSSFQITKNVLEGMIKKLEERYESMGRQNYKNFRIIKSILNKLMDLEDGSRRCNLQIDGKTERKSDT